MFGITPFERNTNLFNAFDSGFFTPFADNCRTDIRDEGDRYIMESELPGFNKEDITLDIDGDCMTLKAEHSAENENTDSNGYICRERSYGSYQRSFDISGVDADNISAEYKNGILIMCLPKKSDEIPASRRLQIN